MKRLGALVALGALTTAMMACSDDDEATNVASKDPVPGSGATTPTTSTGSQPGAIPMLNLEAGAAQQPPADAGPTPEPDAAPNPVPNEPAKRTIWSVDARGHLLRILAEDPADVIDVAKLDLPAGEEVIGLDFRPVNGGLYALTSASRLYTIELATAKATAVGAETNPRVQGQSIGFDFNPVADKIRVQSDVDQNLRLDPTTGTVAGTDGMIAFKPDDPNYLQSPNVVGTAYTNSVNPAPAATELFGIDSTRDLLVKVETPNDGLLTTIGSLGIDIQAMVGFDIWGTGGTTEAYFAGKAAGADATNLYKIDLTTGMASLVGPIAHPHALTGIAVRP